MKLFLLSCIISGIVGTTSPEDDLAPPIRLIAAEMVLTGYKADVIAKTIEREVDPNFDRRHLRQFISSLYHLAIFEESILDSVPDRLFYIFPNNEQLSDIPFQEFRESLWRNHILKSVTYRDWVSETKAIKLKSNAEFVILNQQLFVRLTKEFWMNLLQERVIPVIRNRVTSGPLRAIEDNGGPVPPVIRLRDCESNSAGRDITPNRIHGRFNRNHTLPMGEPADEERFFENMDFFESRIPALVRARVLETLAGINKRIHVDQWMGLIRAKIKGLGFNNIRILKLYTEYLLSFLYMDEELHHELISVNKQQTLTSAMKLAQVHALSGGQPYITAELIFEWYHITRGGSKGTFYIRVDIEDNPLVNLGPRNWAEEFILPRLERLLSTGSERKPFVHE